MTGLCIILIDAVVARQETQKKGHLVVYKPTCASEYKRHRRIFRSSKDECAIFHYVDIAISTTIVNR